MLILNISIIVLLLLVFGFLIWKIKDQANELSYMETRREENAKRFANEKEELQARFDLEKEKGAQLQKKIDSLTCLLCGKPSKGKHFCYSCYVKFKNQCVDLRLKKCAETEIIDFWGNKTEPCEDGRKVRSRAEQCIANYFFNNKIRYVYEKPLNFQGKILHPDFYLPDYNLYIEYNELKDEEYTRKKAFAMKLYEQMNVKIIVMTKEDRENLYEYFCKLLQS